MDSITKIYRKAHSFQNFYSVLASDIEMQRLRILSILKREITQIFELHQKDVLTRAIKDLSSTEEASLFRITQNIADEVAKLADAQLPRYIFHRYRYDVYSKEKILDNYPPYLQIEPSSICNFRCVFCYQTDNTFSQKPHGYMGTMGLDLFKEVIDQIEGKVEFISLASRGEPLVCKDIDAMLEYCVGKFLGLKINTNASLLNEKHCHAILAGGINTVVFSADAAEEPLYSQLRVYGSLEKVLDNIRLFNSIKKKHYPRSKIITRVSGVKFKDEQGMDSMVDLWGKLVDQVAFVTYNPWENVYESPTNTVATPCSDLWRRMFVWHDGKVNPCDTDYKSTLSVGNIKEKSITQLWRCASYEALRKNHLDKQRSKLNPCQRCVVV